MHSWMVGNLVYRFVLAGDCIKKGGESLAVAAAGGLMLLLWDC